jgi:hypothetical protein
LQRCKFCEGAFSSSIKGCYLRRLPQHTARAEAGQLRTHTPACHCCTRHTRGYEHVLYIFLCGSTPPPYIGGARIKLAISLCHTLSTQTARYSRSCSSTERGNCCCCCTTQPVRQNCGTAASCYNSSITASTSRKLFMRMG